MSLTKALLIAEKPSLMRAIQDAYAVVKPKLGFEIDFTSLRGHFMELKEPEEYDSKWGKPWNIESLPIVPNKFEFKIKNDCKADYKKIKEMIFSGKYDFIINGCDAGREGQAIFWSFYESTGAKLPVKRLWASDNTVETLGKALQNLLDCSTEEHLINMKHSSFCRMYLDWLLGMNLSRAASLKISRTLPIGRVMTPTLNMVVTRDLEILNFKPKDYFEVIADFGKYKGQWFKETTNEDGERETLTSFSDRAKAEELIKSLGKDAVVTHVEKKKVPEYAPELHSLSELQKEANEVYGFTASKTLDLAQSLYEKHKILTYPRTSSGALSTNMAKDIYKHLEAIQDIPEVKDFVKNILADPSRIDSTMKNKKYVDNKKITDHHAIIPTTLRPNLSALSSDELKLYLLVVKRFVSIFMNPYVVNRTTIITNIREETFKTTGSTLVAMGYRAVYGKKKEDDVIPEVSKGEKLEVKGTEILAKKTQPPFPYTDKTLIDAMVKAGKFVEDESMKEILKASKGIGTEATRAEIIEKLRAKNMIERKGKTIRATPFGFEVINVLKGKDVISVELTAEWESKLQSIEEGTYDKDAFYKEMIDYVVKETDVIVKNLNTKISPLGTKEVIGNCPKCGSHVVVTNKYYICQEYKKSCDFVFGKVISGKTIPKTEAVKILSGKPSGKMKFKKRDGSTFEAQLIYDKDKGRVSYYFGDKPAATNEALGNCPFCNKKVLHKGSYFACEVYKNGCNFAISFRINNADLTRDDVDKLLSGQETDVKTFTWSSGKKGQARLRFNRELKKLEFIFENSATNKVLGKCPECGSNVLDKGKYCKCDNEKCNFSISYAIRGATINEKDISNILKGGETAEKEFTWKSGKKGKAKLKYENGKLNFIFVK